MGDNYIVENYSNMSCKYMKDSRNMTVVLNENKESDFSELKDVLDKHPGCFIVVDNIYSVEVLKSLISLFESIHYNGSVILKLGSNDSLKDLGRYEVLELYRLPEYVKIEGISLDNKQTKFGTWAHNQHRAYRGILINHLIANDTKAFYDQEKVINDFYMNNIKLLNYYGNTNVLLDELFKLVQRTYPIDRSLSKDDFTGCFSSENDWASDPVEVYKNKKGTADGIAELLSLLGNNSTFCINIFTVKGVLNNGKEHVWNEYVDDDGNIFHYDIAFGLVHIEDNKLSDRKITEENIFVQELRNAKTSITHEPLSYKPNENK